MTLIKMPENPTLEGHKLVIFTPMSPTEGWLDTLKKKYPGLKVCFYELDWFSKVSPRNFPSHEWKDVTILLSGSAFPTPEEAPNMQYVQLVSAGANHVLENPLFRDTDVTFCTANGVHG